MAKLQIRIEDEFKDRVEEAVQSTGSASISAVVKGLLAAWLDHPSLINIGDGITVLSRLPTDEELLFVISKVAQSAAYEDGMQSARYLPLVFSKEIVDALKDRLEEMVV